MLVNLDFGLPHSPLKFELNNIAAIIVARSNLMDASAIIIAERLSVQEKLLTPF